MTAWRSDWGQGAIMGWEFTDLATEQVFAIQPHGAFVINADKTMVIAALQGVDLVMHMG